MCESPVQIIDVHVAGRSPAARPPGFQVTTPPPAIPSGRHSTLNSSDIEEINIVEVIL